MFTYKKRLIEKLKSKNVYHSKADNFCLAEVYIITFNFKSHVFLHMLAPVIYQHISRGLKSGPVTCAHGKTP